MASNYTGLYVNRLESGDIFGVQVVDVSGNGYNLDPQVYIDRGVLPDINSLPNSEEYKKQNPEA